MITIKFLTAAGCVECERAKLILKEIRSFFKNVEIQEIDVMSLKGLELVTKFEILSNPGIIVNNELFSAGELNKEKLLTKIKSLSDK